MRIYLVTVKLPKHPGHDPHNKVTGTCPVGDGGVCTDVTGQHHTYLLYAQTLEGAQLAASKYSHITRIEEVG